MDTNKAPTVYRTVAINGLSGKKCVTRLNGDVIWSNGYMAVRDDPRFMDCFGEFVLDRVVREGELYSLGSNKGGLIIEGEYRDPYRMLDGIRRHFNRGLSTLPQSVTSQQVSLDGVCCLVRDDKPEGFLINESGYFYLLRLSFDELNFHQDEPIAHSVVHFESEGKVKAIMAMCKDPRENGGFKLDRARLVEIGALT